MCAWLPSFNHKHQSSDDGDEYEHKEKIDKYLAETQTNTLKKQIPFINKGEELEHAENAQETEHSQDEEVARRREIRNERKIERQGCHEVYDAKETEGIIFRTWRTIEPENVFDGKEESEDILHDGEHILETSHHSGFRLDERHNETEDNRHHDSEIECLASFRVRIEHDIVEAWLVFEQCKKPFHTAKIRKS